MKFKLPLILVALLASTAEAQITGTYLSNKPTLTSGIFSTTNTFIYVERGGVDVRKVTAPDILDFAGLGLTDVVTHGGAILNGNLTVTGTASSTGLDVINGNVTMTLGANAGGSTRGNNTTKAIRVGVAHYANASNPMAFAYALSESGTSSILWGGGTSLLNAVNLHTWYTTTTTTGGSGSERMRLTPSGFLGIGTTSPTTALDLGAGTLTTTGGIVSGTASLTTLTNSGTITTGTLLATTSISSNILRSSAAGLGAVGFSHPNYIGDTTYYGIKQDSSARTTLNAATGVSGGIILSYDNGVNGTNEVMRAIAGGVVFNEGSADRDFRIEGDTNANLFTLDAGLDSIGIGTATPNATMHVSGSFATSLRATTTSGNITATDSIVTVTGSGVTLTLPTAASITGRIYDIKNTGIASATLATTSSQTIDGQTTAAIQAGSLLGVQSDGANWIVTKRVIPTNVLTVTDTTSITPNSALCAVIYQANTQATGTLTINADTATPVDGQRLLLKLKSTNTQTLSWNAQYVSGSGASASTLPTATTGSSKYDLIGFIYDAVAAKWACVSVATGY